MRTPFSAPDKRRTVCKRRMRNARATRRAGSNSMTIEYRLRYAQSPLISPYSADPSVQNPSVQWPIVPTFHDFFLRLSYGVSAESLGCLMVSHHALTSTQRWSVEASLRLFPRLYAASCRVYVPRKLTVVRQLHLALHIVPRKHVAACKCRSRHGNLLLSEATTYV